MRFVYCFRPLWTIAILDEISKYTLNNEGELISCPNCKEKKVQLLSVVDDAKSFFSMLLALLFAVLSFYVKRKYKCDACGYQFEVKK